MNFNDICTRNDLADFLSIPRGSLSHLLYVKKIENSYTSFTIAKKSGGVRTINAPTDRLKFVQSKLGDALWWHQKSIWSKKNIYPNISHAFEKNKSIITNAKIHRNKRFVYNIDLENFFDSFNFGRIQGFFEKNRDFHVSREASTVIAQLTCYKGCLPQGAPSSPIITNIICQILDYRLLKLAKKYRLDYTRYADDMTFSTNDREFLNSHKSFFEELTGEIIRAGFRVNSEKTRLLFKDSRQEVTGLIVNNKLNVSSIYYKDTRAMAHALYSKGAFTMGLGSGVMAQLEGRFAHINQLDRYNNTINKEGRRNYRTLNGREKQYQQFLFYRYFFANDKPLIVAEGKTDVTYLKAALKNQYLDYPSLITKRPDGLFVFNVSFLKRTDRLKFLFGLDIDGADALLHLYDFFCSRNNNYARNYFEHFSNLSACSPSNPVIFIFDNELIDKNKPLRKFVNSIKLSKNKEDDLKSNSRCKLIDNSNLYLITNPLPPNSDECEIEDLFNYQTLSQVINGKTFSRDDKDFTKHYGKAVFAKHVSKNYQTVDFSMFKPLLDNIKTISGLY